MECATGIRGLRQTKRFKEQEGRHWDTCFDLEHVAIIIIITGSIFLPTLFRYEWFALGAITGVLGGHA